MGGAVEGNERYIVGLVRGNCWGAHATLCRVSPRLTPSDVVAAPEVVVCGQHCSTLWGKIGWGEERVFIGLGP